MKHWDLEDIESAVEHVATIIVMCAGVVLVVVAVVGIICMMINLLAG